MRAEFEAERSKQTRLIGQQHLREDSLERDRGETARLRQGEGDNGHGSADRRRPRAED
jgi:hypothetical protein